MSASTTSRVYQFIDENADPHNAVYLDFEAIHRAMRGCTEEETAGALASLVSDGRLVQEDWEPGNKKQIFFWTQSQAQQMG